MPQLAWWCCDSSSGPRKSFQKILTGCTLHNYPSSALSNIWSTWKDKERKGQKKQQMYCTGHEVSRKKSTTQVMRLKARRSAISPGETTNAIHKEPEGVPAKDKAWRHGRGERLAAAMVHTSRRLQLRDIRWALRERNKELQPNQLLLSLRSQQPFSSVGVCWAAQLSQCLL